MLQDSLGGQAKVKLLNLRRKKRIESLPSHRIIRDPMSRSLGKNAGKFGIRDPNNGPGKSHQGSMIEVVILFLTEDSVSICDRGLSFLL